MANSIKIRAKTQGDTTTVKALMSHVMETGTRKGKDGKLIPAHHITEVNCELNGTHVMTANWGPAVSKNPYLSFKVNGGKAGDVVKLTWTDNQGNSDSEEVKVK